MTDDRTARLVDADRRFVWHPFTQMQGWVADDPVTVIERAEGAWLIDTDGRRYLDGVSSLWVTVHGHRHPTVDAAVRAQLDRVAHSTLLGLSNVPSVELAERLVAITPPGLERVFYSDSGSTAVEVALKMAFQCQAQRGQPERTRFAALTDAYHGDTLGSVSVGGMGLFHGIYEPLLFDVLRAPSPHAYRCPEGADEEGCEAACVAALEALFAAHGRTLAGFVIEPLVQGAAGMRVHPDGYLRRVRQLCDEYDVLLICDEVATGFGRTGTMFACEQEGVAPDLMCLAKGLTAGYLPLAATLCTSEVFDAFLGRYETLRTFFHGHTYTGNPLACAAALGNLDVFEQEATLSTLPARVEALAQRLASLVDHPHVGQVRQKGLMVGIELVADRRTKESFPLARRTGHRVAMAARERGVIVRSLSDVVVLMPPLSVGDDELDLLVDAVGRAIEEET